MCLLSCSNYYYWYLWCVESTCADWRASHVRYKCSRSQDFTITAGTQTWGHKKYYKIVPSCMPVYHINIPPRARIFFHSCTWNFMQRKSKERSVQTCVLEYQVGDRIHIRRPTHGVCEQRGNAYQPTNNHKMVTAHRIQETDISITPLNKWASAL